MDELKYCPFYTTYKLHFLTGKLATKHHHTHTVLSCQYVTTIFILNSPLFGVNKAQQTDDKCHQTLTSNDATALMQNNERRVRRSSNTGAPKGLALHSLLFSLTSRSLFVPWENSGTTGGELAIPDNQFTSSKTETTRRILSFNLSNGVLMKPHEHVRKEPNTQHSALDTKHTRRQCSVIFWKNNYKTFFAGRVDRQECTNF